MVEHVKHRSLPAQQLAEPSVEEVRRAHAAAIAGLQKDANDRETITLANVALPDAASVTIAHRLGRAPRFVAISVPRGAVAAGYVNEIRTGVDRSKVIVLQADDYGATVTVDIEVR